MELQSIDEITVVMPRAEALDAGTAKQFKRQILHTLEMNPRLVIDMSSVNSIDSEGIAVILSCLRTAKEAGGDILLCGLSEQVRSVCALLDFHRVMDTFETREHAVASFPRGDGKEEHSF